jgi:hypothetical protein
MTVTGRIFSPPAAGSARRDRSQRRCRARSRAREPCLVVPALSLRSREFCGGIIGDDAQIVHLLYKIVIFGGYILHPLHPLHPLAQALDILAFGGPDMADM